MSVTVEVPPVATDAGFSVTADCKGSAVPTIVTVGAAEVTAWLLKVAVIVFVPAVLPAVNVAV